MSSDGNPTRKDNGGVPQPVRVPHLTITWDPERYTVALGGSVPNKSFTRILLLLALEAIEEQLANERAQRQTVFLADPTGMPVVRG